LPNPCEELCQQRIVQTQTVTNPFKLCGGGGIAGENGCRITGGETQQEEDEDGDDQHDRDRGQDALQDIDEHFPEGPFRRKEGRPGSGGAACGQR